MYWIPPAVTKAFLRTFLCYVYYYIDSLSLTGTTIYMYDFEWIFFEFHLKESKLQTRESRFKGSFTVLHPKMQYQEMINNLPVNYLYTWKSTGRLKKMITRFISSCS